MCRGFPPLSSSDNSFKIEKAMDVSARNNGLSKNCINQLKWVLLLVLLFFICSTSILAKPLVVVAVYFPPFYIIEKEGAKVKKISGINVDIVTKVLDTIGEPYILEYYPAKRLYSNLIKGSVDIFYGLNVSPEVAPHVIISKNKINKITLRVFSTGNTVPIQKKEDLIGQNIIVSRGWAYGGFINYIDAPANKIKKSISNTHKNGFRMLKKGRAKYLLAFERPARITLKKLPKNYFVDLKWSPPLFYADGHFVISKKTPNAESLLLRMDRAYEKLEKSGIFTY